MSVGFEYITTFIIYQTTADAVHLFTACTK